MVTIKHSDDIIKPAHRFLLFLALCAAGLAGNYFKFSILNAHFIFGSIFAMLALQFLGFSRGVVAAVVISSYTYLAWNHPYAVLTMTAEVAFVGWLISHRKIDMVAADAVYWVAIGIPMGCLCFHFVSHMPLSNAVFLMTKQAINGVANCVVARLIFTAYSVGAKAPRVSLREIVSNLLVFFALATGLIMLIHGSSTDFSETDIRIRESVTRNSRDAAQNIDRWLEDRETSVVNLAAMAAIVAPEQMQMRLEQARMTDKNFSGIAVVDRDATVIAYSPLTDERGISNIGKSFADRPCIPLLKQTLRPMLCQAIESGIETPDTAVTMLAPITSGGQYKGYVAGTLSIDRMNSILEGSLARSGLQYTVLDRNHKVIVTSRKDQTVTMQFSPGKVTPISLGEGLSQWIPELPFITSTIELWGHSSYIVESSVGKPAEWELIVEQPVAPFQKILYDRYSLRLCMLFLIVIALLVLADFLSRRMVSSTKRLASITLDLPEKLASNSLVAWPESAILETNYLITNFRQMADSLVEKFAENRRMNESLEQMVRERTHDLETSQDKLATAVEIARLGHWDYDVANDIFTFNDQFYRLFGVTAEQVGGYRVCSAAYASRFVHPDDIPVVADEIRKAVETSDPHHNRQLEHRIIYDNGTVGCVIVRFLINKDGQGRTIRIYGVTQDITDSKKAQEALRKSEEKFKQVFESANVAKSITLLTGTINVNKAFCNLLGYTQEELENKTWMDLTLLGEIGIIQKTLDSLLKGDKDSARFNKRYIHRDGSHIWADVSVALHRDIDGKPLYFITTIVDITDRKKAEDALEESNRRYKQLIEVAPVGIAVHSEGKIVFTNPAGVRLLGGESEEQIIGKSITEIIHPDRLSSAQSRIQRMLAGEKGLYPAEDVYLKVDGTPITVEVMAVPLPYQGKPAVQVIVTDITAARKAEETQRRLATAIDQATEGVIVTDTLGTIQYVNPAIEQMTGYDAEELMGNKPSILKSGEHDAFFYHQLWSAITAGNTWSGRFINRNKNGRIYYEDATITPVKDASGNILNFVAVKRDVTEHLELSKQLIQAQKMEAVGTLAGGIAHDFNNILQVVSGYSELLLARKQETDQDYTDLHKINSASRRGADLVKNLMMFSRKVEPNLKPLNLNDEVVQIQKLLSRTIPKDIRINAYVSGDLELVNADISQIGQVLMNLAVNARDAMPDGGALNFTTTNVELDEAYCAAHPDLEPGKYVLLAVSDTGVGMSKETVTHIFEPFFTTKEAGKGTGLGLATVFGIVKQHQGHITCYSELGHGTTFKIYLPAIEQTVEAESQENTTAIIGGTETILLVDDEEHLRDLGATILKRYGYDALAAVNGKDALAIYSTNSEKISLVILDLIMPEMDGKKCLAEILNINPKAKVLIASGHAEGILAMESSLPGAKGLVAKPYEMTKLLQKVREVLDAARES